MWPVTEIVTYGFDPNDAPLDKRGTHLSPQEFHNRMLDPNTVVIDVRNFNETVIGKFQPKVAKAQDEKKEKKKDKKRDKKRKLSDIDQNTEHVAEVLDPLMRRSTEFPAWVKNNKAKLEGKQVLMYCTAGVRCERASAFLKNQGLENVYQLDGGIHRYLEAFPKDGGFWVGKNYTFDKRFSHGAAESTTISECVICSKPWERYQAQKKCVRCKMEVRLSYHCLLFYYLIVIFI